MRLSQAISMPIDGIAWSWASLAQGQVQALLPLVAATDPSGREAQRWEQDAREWLASRAADHDIIYVQCMAGLPVAVAFCMVVPAADAARRLVVERLRWLELARPHRSLDAALTILIRTARDLGCVELLIQMHAATEQGRQALAERIAAAGFEAQKAAWLQRLAGDAASGG